MGATVACAVLTGCGAMGGGCSAVNMDILVQPGMLTNDVSVRIVNGSDEMRKVTVSATDPDGNSSSLGPVSVAADDTFTERLGPLMKSYGSTRAELERNGASFEITHCE